MAGRRQRNDMMGNQRASEAPGERGNRRDGYNGALFVATPPTKAPVDTRGKKFSKARVLKAPVQDTPRNQLNDTADTDKAGTYVGEKLAFDELIRIQRGRAEDVGQLVAQIGSALAADAAASDTERPKKQRAARFREEWRLAREDEVFIRMQEAEAAEHMMATQERSDKLEILRLHIKRSIHLFLSSHRDQAAASTPKAKLSNDLLYAQQMDLLLRRLDTQHPFAVVREVVAEARAKFQQLLTSLNSSSAVWNGASLCSHDPPHPESDAEVLNLYENVVEAHSIAQSTQSLKKRPESAATQVNQPSMRFLDNLEKQRELAERQVAERRAQNYWKLICVSRIQACYRRYRRQRQWRTRAASLKRSVEQRAVTILQTKLKHAVKQYRCLLDAREMIKRRHQGMRIALFCFWKCVYPNRCGYASFEFGMEPMAHVVASSTRIQITWKRKVAYRQLAWRRAMAAHRFRRLRRRQWRHQQQLSLDQAQVNHKLAEWTCHVAIEKARITREIERESLRFTIEWAKYESRLEKEVMKSRLSSEWIPQMDPLSGETFYLNVKTTKTSYEHPNLLLYRQLVKKQRVRAEEQYEERRKRLQAYLLRLEEQHREEMEKLFDELHSARRA